MAHEPLGHQPSFAGRHEWLNTMLKVAVEWRVLEAMPVGVKLLKVAPSEVPFYEPHEYERLVEAARNIGDQRLLVFVLLGGVYGFTQAGMALRLHRTYRVRFAQ
jgi:hypothetical protein